MVNRWSLFKWYIVLFSWSILILTTLDLNLQVRNSLRKHDFNSTKYFNKDILRQIRIFIIRDDIIRWQKWLSRLLKSKQDYIKYLETQLKRFLNSLDVLILFINLWSIIYIKTFERFFNLYCFEIDFKSGVIVYTNDT